jgi:hypothetical protein
MSTDYYACEIARSDTEGTVDYENWGVVAVFHEGKVGILDFSHCSCYGTFEDVAKEMDWLTPEEAYKQAKEGADKDMPERTMSVSDYDYDHTTEVYRQLIHWFENDYKP